MQGSIWHGGQRSQFIDKQMHIDDAGTIAVELQGFVFLVDLQEGWVGLLVAQFAAQLTKRPAQVSQGSAVILVGPEQSRNLFAALGAFMLGGKIGQQRPDLACRAIYKGLSIERDAKCAEQRNLQSDRLLLKSICHCKPPSVMLDAAQENAARTISDALGREPAAVGRPQRTVSAEKLTGCRILIRCSFNVRKNGGHVKPARGTVTSGGKDTGSLLKTQIRVVSKRACMSLSLHVFLQEDQH
jgi:hypothetical protein